MSVKGASQTHSPAKLVQILLNKPLNFSQNCPKDMQQIKKHLFKKIYQNSVRRIRSFGICAMTLSPVTDSLAYLKLHPGTGWVWPRDWPFFPINSQLSLILYATKRSRMPVFLIPSNSELKSTVKRLEFPSTSQLLPIGSRLCPRWGRQGENNEALITFSSGSS